MNRSTYVLVLRSVAGSRACPECSDSAFATHVDAARQAGHVVGCAITMDGIHAALNASERACIGGWPGAEALPVKHHAPPMSRPTLWAQKATARGLAGLGLLAVSPAAPPRGGAPGVGPVARLTARGVELRAWMGGQE